MSVKQTTSSDFW